MKRIFKDKKLELKAWLWFIIIVVMLSFVENISYVSNTRFLDTHIRVREKNETSFDSSLHPVINSFAPTVKIRGYPYLEIRGRYILLKLFAPGYPYELNPIYGLLLIAVSVIFLRRMKYYDINKPFSSQMMGGVRQVAFACIIFALADYLRLYLINKYILATTDGLYRLERFGFFDRPGYWAAILIFWLYKILKKAEVLQQEQELTV